jgi:hypothetical protein
MDNPAVYRLELSSYGLDPLGSDLCRPAGHFRLEDRLQKPQLGLLSPSQTSLSVSGLAGNGPVRKATDTDTLVFFTNDLFRESLVNGVVSWFNSAAAPEYASDELTENLRACKCRDY